MELTQEDREAFHNQADRVAEALEGVNEVSRQDKDRAVRVVFMNENRTEMAVLKVLPRHRFKVEDFSGDYHKTYRRDDAVGFLRDILDLN